MKDYSKLKKAFTNDPEMLRSLEQKEQAELLREIASKKINMEGVEMVKGEKGEKGDKGDTGDKGDQGEKGKPGESVTGEKGEPGKDGTDGRNGKDGKNGLNGKDGQKGEKGDTGKSIVSAADPRVVVDYIKNLKGNDRIDISSIRNWENLLKKASGGFDMNDQRWHGASGSGGSLTLETNGVLNGSQTLLNLVDGTGISIIDDGSGNITFSLSSVPPSLLSLQQYHIFNGSSLNTAQDSGPNFTWDEVNFDLRVGDLNYANNGTQIRVKDSTANIQGNIGQRAVQSDITFIGTLDDLVARASPFSGPDGESFQVIIDGINLQDVDVVNVTPASPGFQVGDSLTGFPNGATGTITAINGTILQVQLPPGFTFNFNEETSLDNGTGTTADIANADHVADTFMWSNSIGGSGSGSLNSTQGHALSDGVIVGWSNRVGHDIGDQWDWNYVLTTASWLDMSGQRDTIFLWDASQQENVGLQTGQQSYQGIFYAGHNSSGIQSIGVNGLKIDLPNGRWKLGGTSVNFGGNGELSVDTQSQQANMEINNSRWLLDDGLAIAILKVGTNPLAFYDSLNGESALTWASVPQQTLITFTGPGVDDIQVSGIYTGSDGVSFNVIIDNLNTQTIEYTNLTPASPDLQVGQIITSSPNSYTGEIIEVDVPGSRIVVKNVSNDFNSEASFNNGVGQTADITGWGNVTDLYEWADNQGNFGTGTTENFMQLSFGIGISFGSATGHTFGNQWFWEYLDSPSRWLDLQFYTGYGKFWAASRQDPLLIANQGFFFQAFDSTAARLYPITGFYYDGTQNRSLVAAYKANEYNATIDASPFDITLNYYDSTNNLNSYISLRAGQLVSAASDNSTYHSYIQNDSGGASIGYSDDTNNVTGYFFTNANSFTQIEIDDAIAGTHNAFQLTKTTAVMGMFDGSGYGTFIQSDDTNHTINITDNRTTGLAADYLKIVGDTGISGALTTLLEQTDGTTFAAVAILQAGISGYALNDLANNYFSSSQAMSTLTGLEWFDGNTNNTSTVIAGITGSVLGYDSATVHAFANVTPSGSNLAYFLPGTSQTEFFANGSRAEWQFLQTSTSVGGGYAQSGQTSVYFANTVNNDMAFSSYQNAASRLAYSVSAGTTVTEVKVENQIITLATTTGGNGTTFQLDDAAQTYTFNKLQSGSTQIVTADTSGILGLGGTLSGIGQPTISIQAYGTTVGVNPGSANIHYAFTSSTGPTFVVFDQTLPIGSLFIVSDAGLIASTSTITLDSGIGYTIISPSGAAQQYVMNTNGISVTLQKITSTSFMII